MCTASRNKIGRARPRRRTTHAHSSEGVIRTHAQTPKCVVISPHVPRLKDCMSPHSDVRIMAGHMRQSLLHMPTEMPNTPLHPG